MLYSEVFEMLSAMIAERPEAADTADLRERAPQLLSAAVLELYDLNADYVRGKTGASVPAYSPATSLSAVFPLDGRFAPAVACSAGALLVSGENPELAAFLNSRCDEERSRIRAEIPGGAAAIVNKYPG